MSAKKMIADSTQGDPEPNTPKCKKPAQKKRKKQSSKKKRVSKSDDENSDLDLEKELLPIESYINDRQEMVNQMFNSLKGSSLKRHIPDILKEMNIEELKRRCVEQVEVMSKKRIRRILAGDNPDDISSSGTEDENTDEEQTSDQGEVQVECEMNENTVDSTSASSEVHINRVMADEMVKGGHLTGLSDNDTANIGSEEGEITTAQGSEDEVEERDEKSGLSVNQMELLELEMRARAIKAMLQAQELKDKQQNENG